MLVLREVGHVVCRGTGKMPVLREAGHVVCCGTGEDARATGSFVGIPTAVRSDVRRGTFN